MKGPKKGEGGWRARVIAADTKDAPELLEYTMKRKKSGEAEPSEMRAVSKLADWYLRAYEDHARVRAKASALRDEAARMGDIQAINDQYDSADKNDLKATASILSRGVKVGSSRLLLERGGCIAGKIMQMRRSGTSCVRRSLGFGTLCKSFSQCTSPTASKWKSRL